MSRTANTDSSRFFQRPAEHHVRAEASELKPLEPNPERLAKLEALRVDGLIAVAYDGKTISIVLPEGVKVSIGTPTGKRLVLVPMIPRDSKVALSVVVDSTDHRQPFYKDELPHTTKAPVSLDEDLSGPPPAPDPKAFENLAREAIQKFFGFNERRQQVLDAGAAHSEMMSDIEQIRTMQSNGTSTPELDRRLTMLLRRLDAMNNAEATGA